LQKNEKDHDLDEIEKIVIILKGIQARGESTSVKKRSEVHNRSWGIFLGSKGVQEEFSWSFKGEL
jgi:hypothetical protein